MPQEGRRVPVTCRNKADPPRFPVQTLRFFWVEVNFWGAGAKGAGHARAKVSVIGQGDGEVEESGRKVREGGAGSWMGRSPSYRCYVGARVVGSIGLEVEVGFW